MLTGSNASNLNLDKEVNNLGRMNQNDRVVTEAIASLPLVKPLIALENVVQHHGLQQITHQATRLSGFLRHFVNCLSYNIR
jgi:hypothetical protein